jgi:hypothetical protein
MVARMTENQAPILEGPDSLYGIHNIIVWFDLKLKAIKAWG